MSNQLTLVDLYSIFSRKKTKPNELTSNPQIQCSQKLTPIPAIARCPSETLCRARKEFAPASRAFLLPSPPTQGHLLNTTGLMHTDSQSPRPPPPHPPPKNPPKTARKVDIRLGAQVMHNGMHACVRRARVEQNGDIFLCPRMWEKKKNNENGGRIEQIFLAQPPCGPHPVLQPIAPRSKVSHRDPRSARFHNKDPRAHVHGSRQSQTATKIPIPRLIWTSLNGKKKAAN